MLLDVHLGIFTSLKLDFLLQLGIDVFQRCLKFFVGGFFCEEVWEVVTVEFIDFVDYPLAFVAALGCFCSRIFQFFERFAFLVDFRLCLDE